MAKVSKIAGQIAQWSNKPTNEMSELGVQRNFWFSNIDILVDFSILFSILYSRLVRFVISMNSTIVYIYFTLRESKFIENAVLFSFENWCERDDIGEFN